MLKLGFNSLTSDWLQDDLFPPTRVLWEPAVSGADWAAGEDGAAAWVSLRPRDMSSVSGGGAR